MRPGILAIVGVGLIGGSIGKAAKERRLAERVIGVEPNADSAQWAVENGVLDAVVSQVPDNADLIALCVPSDLVAQWVIKLADHTAPMFDVGSVKEPIVKEIELTHSTDSVCACHPISGSEKEWSSSRRWRFIRWLHGGVDAIDQYWTDGTTNLR